MNVKRNLSRGDRIRLEQLNMNFLLVQDYGKVQHDPKKDQFHSLTWQRTKQYVPSKARLLAEHNVDFKLWVSEALLIVNGLHLYSTFLP